jgi:hypothetical protein
MLPGEGKEPVVEYYLFAERRVHVLPQEEQRVLWRAKQGADQNAS